MSGMTDRKKSSVALLICLLLMLWLGAGAADCAGLSEAARDEASGNAGASMRAANSGFDLLDTGDVVRAGLAGVGQNRPELIKTGVYAVITILAVIFSVAVMRLRLCQIVYIPFNFNWMPAYIHKKDGMK